MSSVGHLPPEQKLKRGEVLLQYTRVLDQPDYTPVPFHKQQVKTIKADLSWSFTKLMKKIHKHDGGAEPPHHIKEMLFDVAQEEKRKKDELEAAKKAFKDRFTGVKGLSRFGHEVKKPSEEDDEDTDTDGMSSEYTSGDATSDADSSLHSEQSDAEQSQAEQSEAEEDAYEPPAAPPSPPAVPAPDPEEPVPEVQAEADAEPGSGSPVEEQPAEEPAVAAEQSAVVDEQPQVDEQVAPEAEAEVAAESAEEAPAAEEAIASEEAAVNVESEVAPPEAPVESEAVQPEEVTAGSEPTGSEEAAASEATAVEPEEAAAAEESAPGASEEEGANEPQPEPDAVASEPTEEVTPVADDSVVPSSDDVQPAAALVDQLENQSGTNSEKGPSRRRSLQASKDQLESEAAHTPSASPLPVSEPLNRRRSYNPDANEGESAFADGMIVARRSSIERRSSQTRSRPTSGIVRAAASLPQSTHNSRPTSATITAESNPDESAPIQVARTASRPSSGSYKAKVLTSRPSSDANATRLSRRNSGIERAGSSLGAHTEVEEKEEKGDESTEAKVPTEEEEKQANAAAADPVLGQEFDYDAIRAEQAENPDGGFLKPTTASAEADEPDERKIIAGSVLVAEDDDADEVISAEATIERTGPKPYGFLPFLKLSRNGFTKEVRFPGFGDKYINPPIGWLREKYRFAAPAGVHAFVTLHAYGYVIYAKNNIRF